MSLDYFDESFMRSNNHNFPDIANVSPGCDAYLPISPCMFEADSVRRLKKAIMRNQTRKIRLSLRSNFISTTYSNSITQISQPTLQVLARLQ